MGYTIVLELQDIEHDETTRIYYGHFETFGQASEAMAEVREQVWPEDDETNRIVEVAWRALRDFDIDNINIEVTRFINRGRRKKQ